MAKQEDLFKNVVSHAKEYGFIFPSSEIYDGLSAVYDYAQNGVELKKNIREYWWRAMVQMHENIVGLDAAILMHPTTWKASGHVDAFNDPLIDNKDSKKRYRADVLIEDHIQKLEDKINKEVEKAKKKFENFAPLLGFETKTTYGNINIINCNRFFTGFLNNINLLVLWMLNNPDSVVTINHPSRAIFALEYSELINKIITSSKR